jgi:hypothetical protein
MTANNLDELRTLFESGATPPFRCVKNGKEKMIHYFTDGILFFK